MINSKLIKVFEHQKLYIDEQNFQKKHFDTLVKFNEQNQNKYFDIGHNKIIFKNYVGVIQIDGIVIEILPKSDHSTDTTLWRNVLLKMLDVCNYIQINSISETQLRKRYNSILEIYFDLYLQEIEYLIKRGLIKQYRIHRGNQLALKGKLIFAQNIQKNLVHKEQFYCQYQVYDKDHLIHHILFQALLVLNQLHIIKHKDRLKKLLFEFDGVQPIKVTRKQLKTIALDRKSKVYRKALEMAKMLLLNYSPNISSGQQNMLALLFDMNKLWEEYIYKILNKYKPAGYLVSFQNSNIFWKNKTIRPDIVITDRDQNNFIIDAKWKIVTNNKPSDDDLKQMFAYNLLWKASKSMLLYPKVDQNDTSFGNFSYKHPETLNNQCKLGFVSVLDGNSMKSNHLIAKEIFEKWDFNSSK